MDAQIEKRIEVTIELEKKEKDLLYDVFDLLERISDILTSNDLYDDDHFTISVKGETNCLRRTKQVYELDEFRSRFDEFLE